MLFVGLLFLCCLFDQPAGKVTAPTWANSLLHYWRKANVRKAENGDIILSTFYKFPKEYSNRLADYWTREDLIGNRDGSKILSTSYRFSRFPIGAARDCNELYSKNRKAPSGVYSISPSRGKTYLVYCDMETGGGGWTVIQRRVNGSLDFYKTWKEYKDGFGSVNGEYWLGNEAIHALTSIKKRDLYIRIQGRGKAWTYATYTGFYVESELNKYKMAFDQGSYKGNAGNHLNQGGPGEHNGMKFSTKDVDNDLGGGGKSCAHILKGGWWFNNCEYGCLNCQYGNSDSAWGGQGILTGTWMMIR